MATVEWTAAELAALFRAKDAVAAGYLDEWDIALKAGEGTVHVCFRLDRALPPATTQRTGTVLRALRGMGLF